MAFTKEELTTIIADEVKAAVTAAMSGAKAEPGDDANREEKAMLHDDKTVEHKYASIYMPANNGISNEEKPKLAKGIGWVRAMKSVAQSGGDSDKALYVAQKMYSDDATLHREMKAMSITAPSEGGYLVPEVYAQEVIELLRPLTIIGALHARRVSMPNGNMTIPKLRGGAKAHYIGEKRKGKASGATVGTVKLSAKKLITKVVITNDLLRSNTYGADQMILDDALAAMAERQNAALLNGKGTEYEPKGILNIEDVQRWSVGAMPGNDVTGSMLARLLQKNVRDNGSLGFVLNGYLWEALYNTVNSSGNYVYRASMDEGKLGKYPYFVSDAIGTGKDANEKTSMILGRWSDFIIGDQLGMETRLFDQGTVEDEDGTISAVDDDCSILRIISTHDFGVRHEESFVVAKDIYTKSST